LEISSLEISLLTKKISDSLAGYFVSGVYSIEGGVLIRLNHATKPEKLVAISSFAPWITTKNLSLPQSTKFVSQIRDRIERCNLVAAEQLGSERIAKFVFESRKNEVVTLYAEFFSRGNLILADNENKIISVENPQTYRHRRVVVGERYEMPPSRGIPLQKVNEDTLLEAYSKSQNSLEEKKLLAIRWFGRNIATSRKFVEEIFERSEIRADAQFSSLGPEAMSTLARTGAKLVSELNESAQGFILVPSEESDLDPDVCPIIPRSWKRYEEEKIARIESFPSLSEALDEVQIHALVLTNQRRASSAARAKADELSSAISKQKLQIEWNEKASGELRKIASDLMRMTEPKIERETIEKLTPYKILEVPREAPTQMRFVNEPRSFLSSFTPSSLASRLYDEAKRLEEGSHRVRQVMSTLEQEKNALLDQSRSQEERAERKLVTERRERQWYERYRWFVLFDSRLVVGGRDATSNSIMINKYTEKNDVVFHADLHGSPFFVLRSEGVREPPSDEIALEMAQATVSFSRAWKDELGSADAYWVYGDQVRKAAPTGEYLPRGSFFIEGKKNFVRHVKVRLAVGITSHLPKEGSASDDGMRPAVVCGPEKSITKDTIARLRITPGKEKSSNFARRLKQLLVKDISDPSMLEAAKKLTIDEIIRVLPSGGYKIIFEENRSLARAPT
jgi:predicted ribosome quality control (RQC) complex YloA/Tae2 family protein